MDNSSGAKYFPPEHSRNQLRDIEMTNTSADNDADEDDVSIDDDSLNNSPTVTLAINLSFYCNWALLFVKLYCYIISSSKAVAAALADSVVDILSQMVLKVADIYINKHSADYPVGRSRLEALSVLGCAGLMIVASVEVIQGTVPAACCLNYAAHC